MADSFQQRISLEGAEDIIKNLQTIGSEATKAIAQLKTSVTAANPALAALSTSSEAAQKGVLGFTQALGGLSAVLGPVSGGLTALLGTFTAFGRAGGALAAVGGLVAFTKSAADSVIATQNMARAFGLTVEQFKTLGRAAQQAGVDQESLNTALGRFAQKASAEAGAQAKSLIDVVKQAQAGLPEIRILDVDQIKKFQAAVQQALPQVQAAFQQITGTAPSPVFSQFEAQLNKLTRTSEEFRNSLRELGIDVPAITFLEKASVAAKKLDGSFASLGISLLGVGTQAKAPFEAFLDLADKIKNTPDGLQKTALAAKTLGRTAGPELLAALNLGREGIEQIQAALAKQGVFFSQDQIDAAREFRKSIIELDASTNSFKKTILETFGPALSAGINATITDFKRLKQIFSGDTSFFAGSPIDQFIEKFKADLATLPPIAQSAFELVGTAIVDGLKKGAPALGPILDGIKFLFAKTGDEAAASFTERFGNIAKNEALSKALEQFIAKTGQALPAVIKFGQAGKAAIDGIAAGLTSGANAWDSYDASVQRAGRDFAASPFGIGRAQIASPFGGGAGGSQEIELLFAPIKKAADEATTDAERLKAAFAEFTPAATTAAATINTTFEALATQAQSTLTITQQLIQALRELATIPQPQLGGAGTGTETNPGGFARGGRVWGPGSGTSDSILARLSRGEFVIQAAAVSHYGPQLLHALNAMRLPRLPGFSLGGLADGLGRTLRANLAIPGMAAGGPTPAPAKANTVPITLDLRTDRGRFRGSAMADREVAEALSRFAVIDQITSMGKKSGAY